MPSPIQSEFITHLYQQTKLTPFPVIQAILDVHDKTLLWSDEEEGVTDIVFRSNFTGFYEIRGP